jgi:hypothetical protein
LPVATKLRAGLVGEPHRSLTLKDSPKLVTLADARSGLITHFAT